MLSIPPVANLRELERVADELTAKRNDNLDSSRRWLAVLVAPRSSLGGAHPKANFVETGGAPLRSFGSDFHTFSVQRFDRVSGRRRFCAAAMALPRRYLRSGRGKGRPTAR